MAKRAKGGNVTPAEAAARVEIAEKSALIAVEVPKAPAKPKVKKAVNMDEALEHLGVSFKVQLRDLEGKSSREKVNIESLEDFEEATIVEKSSILSEQKRQMTFLHDFQNELQNNPVFVDELIEFLEGEKREAFLNFLKAWNKELKKPNSQFLELLKS
jgi:hypothetical protein